MVFGLTIGTERAAQLQQSIQDELTTRGFSPDADPVMAEYITIMIINNKTAAQITTELEDLIGPDFDPSFTDWLFQEAAKGAPDAESTALLSSSPSKPSDQPSESEPPKDLPSQEPSQSRPGRNGVYQQALSQALPSGQHTGQKRTASARSPSPSQPNKSRRTDLPTGPRAMHRDGQGPNSRSLLERVGGRGPKNFQRDDIQARIDNITNIPPDQNMMMQPGFPPMGMEMNPMANPMMLQEMMLNQMALMAQVASTMGIINPAQFGAGPGFPMQQGGMPGDVNGFPNNNMNNGFQQQQPQMGGNNAPANGSVRGRGGAVGRGGRGTGRGRGGGPNGPPSTSRAPASGEAAPVVAPQPVVASAPVDAAATNPPQPAFAIPERPQSPTLCKFGLKCTNAHCRWSHPSPVATTESGVVLSNDPCENGKNCKDKDCIKAHPPKPLLHQLPLSIMLLPPLHTLLPFPVVSEPTARVPDAHSTILRAKMLFPVDSARLARRHNVLSSIPEAVFFPLVSTEAYPTTGGLVNVSSPETGSMGGTSHNRSVTFNNSAATKERLEKQMKEIEQRKNEAEKAVKEAEAAAAAAANGKTVPTAA